jgi:anhydro-N-acetylmuramic acid kinase
MFKQNYNVIGVMSGTSLDGVDLAHIRFSKNSNWNYEILEAETISYTDEWLNKLKLAVNFSEPQLEELNVNYTHLLAEIINDFIVSNTIENLDAICSHGHTILHKPNLGYTLQIGNLPIISELINQDVVCDFRVQDVELGGQGAPLVPIGDMLLFSDYDYCLNLGGFSNISFQENNQRIAFDISAVNTVLNFYSNLLGFSYDDKGEIARSGKLDLKLFDNLNNLEFYNLSYPKSLGIEFVNEFLFPIIESYKISEKDKLNTFVEHIAFQISKVITKKETSLLITGGGVYNEFLIDRIKYYLPYNEVVIPSKKTIEFKEALIFAFLGVLKLRNEINVLCSVTGANMNHSSGNIYKKNREFYVSIITFFKFRYKKYFSKE